MILGVCYAERFALMMAQMRKELNAENVPVIVGELRGDVPFNKVVRSLPDKVPRCAWVSSKGLGSGDVHFDAEGYRAFGTIVQPHNSVTALQ